MYDEISHSGNFTYYFNKTLFPNLYSLRALCARSISKHGSSSSSLLCYVAIASFRVTRHMYNPRKSHPSPETGFVFLESTLCSIAQRFSRVIPPRGGIDLSNSLFSLAAMKILARMYCFSPAGSCFITFSCYEGFHFPVILLLVN